MRFRDELTITLKAGDGGPGRVSFRREKYIPKGGPDGGDGGKGGDIIFLTDPKLMSLESLATQRIYRAPSGEKGGQNNCSGKSGNDLILKVPVGTLVKDPEHGNVLKDLDHNGASVIIALGGKGGRGNTRFATATDRVPSRAEEGMPGEEREVKLELKLIADAGLVGFPNAGKSTLLAALSHARPKIGNYAFTTLSPNIGVVEVDYEPYVIADVPGLIEGASQGKGLGDRFLRHVERTRVLLHLVDASDPEAVEATYATVRDEIAAYSADLAKKPELVVFTKLDLVDDEGRTRLVEIAKRLEIAPVLCSSSTGEGLETIRQAIVERVRKYRSQHES